MTDKRSISYRFKQNRPAYFGALFILLLVVVASLGAYVRPDSSKDANMQQLSIARSPIGATYSMLKVSRNQPTEHHWASGFFFGGLANDLEVVYDSLSYSVDGLTTFWKGNALGTSSLADICYPLQQGSYSFKEGMASFDTVDGRSLSLSIEALKTEVESNRCIERRFLLGTDSLGRDLLSRLMAGIIVSLSVGLISVLISLTIGITLGAIAGYFRGWVDEVVMWLINVIWSIPTLLMVIAITLVLGKGFVQVFIAVGLTMWVEVARIVRGQFISLREAAFIEAGRSMGFSHSRLMLRHMLPNAMGPVIVISAANFASAILIEAGLSFLGIGTQIPMASWGTMIKEHYGYITTDLAYLAYLPGLCITALVLAFTLVGNGLRDALDVRN